MQEAFKDSKEKSLFCAKAALEKKAFNVTILELKKASSLTDYFLICSGRSDRQVQAIAESIEEKMSEQGARPLGEEGLREGRWVLMDYDDVVIHIFYDPVRRHYDLEGLWIEAPRIDPPEDKG
ncbi:MAG: ribosome silencing factor [Deltaproteobacteria bacterium]|nr:ribosome silencing factor [Deltaproteobacteria bacterium]